MGSRADATHTRNTLGHDLRLYQDKGYDLAEVKLIEGGNPGETKVVIQIFEGPKVKIGSINFVGNEFASAATLQTHIGTRKPILGLFGKYHRDMLDDDKQKLIEYYQGHGFFEVRVTPAPACGEGPRRDRPDLRDPRGEAILGPRRDHRGEQKIKTAVLKDDLELHSGKPYLQAVRDADKARMLIKYNEIGCIDTQIVAEPRWTNKPGVVDLVYKIKEGEPYLLGELKIQGNSRTRDKVIRREAVQAGLLPGEVLDKNRIDLFQKRLTRLGYFQNNPQGQTGKQITVEIVDRRPKDKPYGELMMPLIGETTQARMQDPGGDQPAPLPVPDALPPLAPQVPNNPGGAGGPGLFNNPSESVRPEGTPAGTMPPIAVPPPASPVSPPGGRRSPRSPARVRPPSVPASRRRSFPSIPGMGMTQRRPRPQRPVPQPGLCRYRDLGRGGPHRPVHDRRRGQQLPGADGQRQHLRVELRPVQPAEIHGRHRQRPGLPRRRPVVADQPLRGHPYQHDAGQPPTALPLRPHDRCRRDRLSVPAPLYQLGRAPRRCAGQPGETARHQRLFRRLRLG